ncbi:MAG: hypothetical protein HYR85_15710 [Planctomycetes bacterium]|nr:hypothetical protein [Planctomycetota bacterium]MBI3848123.1 hypothetical protein [Planctomycetota bacterium]
MPISRGPFEFDRSFWTGPTSRLWIVAFFGLATAQSNDTCKVWLPKPSAIVKASDFIEEIRPGGSCDAFRKGHLCRDDGHWAVEIDGHECEKLDVAARLAAASSFELEPAGGASPARLSARTVVIRADALSPYSIVNGLLGTCSLCGIYKVEVGTANPATPK